MKIFPHFAAGISHMICYQLIDTMYRQLIEDCKVGKFELLDLLHHYTSGFKSVFTEQCFNGLLVIRQSLGGAGFTAWSGLPQAILDCSPATTYEGDNTVMAQQSARYIFKQVSKIMKGNQCDGVFTYLNEAQHLLKSGLKCGAKTPEEFVNLEKVEEAMKVNLCYTVFSTALMVKKSKIGKAEQMNTVFATDIVKMSRTHTKYLQFKLFKNLIEQNTISANIKSQLINLCGLLGLTLLEEDCRACYEVGYFSPKSSWLLSESIKLLLERIRPQIIPLAESFAFPDSYLTSAIGNSFGDIYETHLKWAQESRLNQNKGGIPSGFMENIMPIVKGKL